MRKHKPEDNFLHKVHQLAANKNTVIGYFEALEPIYALIKECEEGRDVMALLKGPECHGGFKRLN